MSNDGWVRSVYVFGQWVAEYEDGHHEIDVNYREHQEEEERMMNEHCRPSEQKIK